MTAQQLITENIDLWTSTIKARKTQGRGSNKKRELYGLKKLRELILELAVRGKLVPQDASDEPASLLLERIVAEKAQLIKDKKIKKQKVLPEITDEEKRFGLPDRWAWTRLSDVYDVRDGTHDSPKSVDDGVPLVTSKNLSSGKLDLANIKYISIEDHLKIQERSAVEINDILFAMIGSIGNPVLVDIDPNFSIKNVALFKYYNLNSSSPNFLKYFLEHSSKIFKEESSGAVQSFVSLGKIRSFVFALPPLKEQHRIVAKVDELMALCDQLEQQTESSLDAHNLLVATLLSTLTDAHDAKELSHNWARFMATDGLYAGNAGAISGSQSVFDTLITTDYAVEQLKQTILQLAVMGKLVPQNPNDEPASELLKRIATKKAQLIKDKKIKKQKPLPEISDEEKPFELPDGWEWKRLGDLSYVFSGNSFRSNDFNNISGTRVIKITNAGVGEILETNDFLPEEFFETHQNFKVIQGDLILALTRPYISTGLKVSACPPLYHNALLNQRVAAIRTFSDTEFLYQYMQSSYVLGLYQKRFGGSGLQPNLKICDVTELVIPVPPLEEQHRIVTKVEELMTLCEQLKSQLNNAQTTQLHLSDAVVENALSA